MKDTSAKHVLIVDGNEDIRQLIDIAVRNTGNEATIVSTIEEARRLIFAGKFDMIICDVGMDDGLCEQLVVDAHSLNPSLPIIVFADHYRRPFSSPLRDDNCFQVERFNFKQLAEVVRALFEDSVSIGEK